MGRGAVVEVPAVAVGDAGVAVAAEVDAGKQELEIHPRETVPKTENRIFNADD